MILLFFLGDPTATVEKNESVFKAALIYILDFMPYLAYAISLADISVRELLVNFGTVISKLKQLFL